MENRKKHWHKAGSSALNCPFLNHQVTGKCNDSGTHGNAWIPPVKALLDATPCVSLSNLARGVAEVGFRGASSDKVVDKKCSGLRRELNLHFTMLKLTATAAEHFWKIRPAKCAPDRSESSKHTSAGALLEDEVGSNMFQQIVRRTWFQIKSGKQNELRRLAPHWCVRITMVSTNITLVDWARRWDCSWRLLNAEVAQIENRHIGEDCPVKQ